MSKEDRATDNEVRDAIEGLSFWAKRTRVTGASALSRRCGVAIRAMDELLDRRKTERDKRARQAVHS